MIEHLWVFCGTNPKTGEETILADRRNGQVNAFIATTAVALETSRPAAMRSARRLGLELEAVKFIREG